MDHVYELGLAEFRQQRQRQRQVLRLRQVLLRCALKLQSARQNVRMPVDAPDAHEGSFVQEG